MSLFKFFKTTSDNKSATIRMLFILCLVLLGLLFYQMNVATDARRHLKIDIPPDLSEGATILPGQKQLTTVYGFATRFFQQLHHWRYSGYQEYPKNIKRYQEFFTPSYRAFLSRDLKRRMSTSELIGRTRTMYPVLSAWDKDRVKVTSRVGSLATSWVVLVDFELIETYKGEEIKRLTLRYPLRVVRADINVTSNPWGLLIDGYADEPKKLTKEDMQ